MNKPRLNIIHDSRMIERYDPLIKELKRQHIDDFEIWPCLILPSVVSSINESHKMIVRHAKESGIDEVAIAEDDVIFPANDGWEYYLRNKPKEYDIYVACTYCIPISNNIMTGFHLYMVNAKFYEAFLSLPNNVHIDTAMNDLNGNWKFCYPFAALQRPGWSSNNNAVCNYNSILSNNDVYGKFRD